MCRILDRLRREIPRSRCACRRIAKTPRQGRGASTRYHPASSRWIRRPRGSTLPKHDTLIAPIWESTPPGYTIVTSPSKGDTAIFTMLLGRESAISYTGPRLNNSWLLCRDDDCACLLQRNTLFPLAIVTNTQGFGPVQPVYLGQNGFLCTCT